MPRLKPLRLVGIPVQLRSIIDVIPQLDFLDIPSYLIIHSSALQPVKEKNLDQSALYHHCLTSLFPPHLLQALDYKLFIEWDQGAFSKLPLDATELYFMIPAKKFFGYAPAFWTPEILQADMAAFTQCLSRFRVLQRLTIVLETDIETRSFETLLKLLPPSLLALDLTPKPTCTLP